MEIKIIIEKGQCGDINKTLSLSGEPLYYSDCYDWEISIEDRVVGWGGDRDYKVVSEEIHSALEKFLEKERDS
jgi:hypothetical protein